MSTGLIDKALSVEGIGNCIYPVGSIYMSTSPTSPADIWGGTWQRITGKFLLAATDGGSSGGNSTASVVAGGTGGSATHTLTEGQLPSISGTFNLRAASTSYSNSITSSSGKFDVSMQTASSAVYPFQTVSGTQGKYQQAKYAFGSGQSHNNMPPYLSVYVWQRLTLAEFSGGGSA